MPDTPVSISSPDLLGGRYRLLETVARGGMATVHRATDEVLGRDVAVKVLHPHLAEDPVFLERFRREARTAASLSHPNLVGVHDWGELPEGPYMVLEFVEGMSLREVLRIRGRVTPAEALALLGPAAAGLAAAHEAGLVHRDVKPENILLGNNGVVKVTDFGLSHATARTSTTFGDAIVGSPHYLAPEAVRGEVLDGRADVYGLGIVLFELLTGRPPFQRDTAYATAMAHTTATVPRPSSIVSELPGDVDDVVRRATAPEAADRFPDPSSFALALSDAVPEGPSMVDLRDGSRQTVVLPGDARETIVGLEKGRPKARRKRRWKRRLVWLAPLLLALAALLVWDQVLAPMSTVPDVVGDPREEAVATLEAAGFEARIDASERHDLDVPEDHVLAQDPSGEARQGSTVTLVLSAGPRQHVLPPMHGMSEEEALATLEELNLTADVARAFDEEVPAGEVVLTEPPAGHRVDEGTTVRLVISQGKQPIELPGVAGSTVDEARATLRDLGLDPEVVEERYHAEIPAGVVIEQRPEPGAVVYRGDRVELVVSKGPEPFAIPDVEGESEERARAVLEDLGLVVEVEYVETIFFFREGEVDAQDPAPGTPVRPGDTVRIYVWR